MCAGLQCQIQSQASWDPVTPDSVTGQDKHAQGISEGNGKVFQGSRQGADWDQVRGRIDYGSTGCILIPTLTLFPVVLPTNTICLICVTQICISDWTAI